MRIVSSIVSKNTSPRWICCAAEALLLARMNADSTYLVDKRAPGYSSKLERSRSCSRSWPRRKGAKSCFSPNGRRCSRSSSVESSGLISITFGSMAPCREEAAAVGSQFQRDPVCRLFLTTNAGSTGLNLQRRIRSSTWSAMGIGHPGRRIARAHRIGTKNRCRSICS